MNLGQESETVEFKDSLAQLDKGLKSLTAMLNKNGYGEVYFGVEDDGNVIGFMVGKRTLDDIKERAKMIIAPKVMPTIEETKLGNGLSYVKVSASGTDVPYSCDGRYFIRNYKGDDQVPNDLLRKILASGKHDLLIGTTSPLQTLTFKELGVILLAKGVHVREESGFYKSKNFYNEKGEFNLMAFILSDQSTVSLKVVSFSGKDKASMSTFTEYGKGCLLSGLERVKSYFKSIDVVNVDLSSGDRIEKPLFDFESFEQGWVNACLHNEWINMVPPAVYVYDDRLEIVSYGSLPFDLSLDEFYTGTSKPVNPALMVIFQDAGLVEQSGHGIPHVVKHYGKGAFSLGGDMVKVTIPFAYIPDAVIARGVREKASADLTEKQIALLKYLSEHGDSTLEEAAATTGISVQGAKKAVKVLKDKGLLAREGSKQRGRWIAK